MLSQTSTPLTVIFVTPMATKPHQSMWREGTRSHMEVFYRCAVLVPKMQENNKHVVLQFSTYQRNFHMNFMAIERSLLRTDRKRWKNMMVSFEPWMQLFRRISNIYIYIYFKFKTELDIITVVFLVSHKSEEHRHGTHDHTSSSVHEDENEHKGKFSFLNQWL